MVALAFLVCTEKKASNPVENRPPETHLFLVIGDSLGVADTTARPDTSASTLILHWYGDDPDGEILGYQWAWDDTSTDTSWTFTDGVMDTFYVKIRTVFDYFTFYVRAMDTDSSLDPTPSVMTFPIINSPPEVQLPVGLINDYSAEHSITLGYQTLSWTASDPDGDETISGFEVAIADSSFHWDPTLADSINFADLAWTSLDSLTYSYTFGYDEPYTEPLAAGCYRAFLRAVDIADSYSDVIWYPETTGVWEVIAPVGDILYIDDNSYYTANDSMYVHILNTLGLGYTALNFVQKPFYYTRDLELALNDFDILVYNAGSARHFEETALAITNFVNNGGHLLMNSSYSSSDTIIYSFMPIDTIYDSSVQRPIKFIQPDTANALVGYPDTLQTNQPLSFVFGFRPQIPVGIDGSGFKVLYIINSTVSDPGSVGDTVAVRFPYNPDLEVQEPAKVVFFSFPVFDCNVNNGFSDLFTHVIQNEFGQ